MSALSDLDWSLQVNLITKFAAPDEPVETLVVLKFLSLLDSGSTDNFLDTSFVHSNDVPTSPISPINLQLFDGSLAHSAIMEMASLKVHFPSGELLPLTFYVTPLDSSCKAVLRYSFLTCYNPSIDWVKYSITFHSPLLVASSNISAASDANASDRADRPSTPTPVSETKTSPRRTPPPYEPIYSYPTIPSFSARASPKISIISAAAFVRACAEDGAQQFTLHPTAPGISGMAGSTAPPDLSDVPAEYHEFADVFSDSLSEKLPEHRPYDLKINLEEDTSPPLGPIYSLSESKLKALHEFIDDNVCNGSISPTQSSSTLHQEEDW